MKKWIMEIITETGHFLEDFFKICGQEQSLLPTNCVFQCPHMSAYAVKGVDVLGKNISLPCCTVHKKELEAADSSWPKNHLFSYYGVEKWTITSLVLD